MMPWKIGVHSDGSSGRSERLRKMPFDVPPRRKVAGRGLAVDIARRATCSMAFGRAAADTECRNILSSGCLGSVIHARFRLKEQVTFTSPGFSYGGLDSAGCLQLATRKLRIERSADSRVAIGVPERIQRTVTGAYVYVTQAGAGSYSRATTNKTPIQSTVSEPHQWHLRDKLPVGLQCA